MAKEAAILSQFLVRARSAQTLGQFTGEPLENQPKSALSEAKKSATCDGHKANKTCTENCCKWKGTTEKDGKCTVDESKGTTQTNTGGEGEKTSKCKGIESKEKYEAVQETAPHGKKSVCGWITYEDGKETLEKPYCRDSSFLLNKKLALIISAFVALLF
uniref:Variant surface glycoprotein n=1 Tax=Trypanosoma brucei TaxID=5691 RepID=A0A1V0FYA3_9TRYP|nr:variant surface glycoprotein [Trypanosoma brucei]